MSIIRFRSVIRGALHCAGLLLVLSGGLHAATPARPNILWITCEDSSPHLGAYGDTFAVTPNLDAFARASVRYTRGLTDGVSP